MLAGAVLCAVGAVGVGYVGCWMLVSDLSRCFFVCLGYPQGMCVWVCVP